MYYSGFGHHLKYEIRTLKTSQKQNRMLKLKL